MGIIASVMKKESDRSRKVEVPSLILKSYAYHWGHAQRRE